MAATVRPVRPWIRATSAGLSQPVAGETGVAGPLRRVIGSSGHRVIAALRFLPALLVLLPWLSAAPPTQHQRIAQLAGPSAFKLLDWEATHLAERADRVWAGLVGAVSLQSGDSALVQAYFDADSPTREWLRPAAEAAIERSIAAAYTQAGATRSEAPLLGRLLPPVLTALTPPPNVLVVSPRTEFRVVQSVILSATLDVADQERLEAAADSDDVSTLVAPIGGIATYPAMVLESDSPTQVLTSAAHEWAHQYLFFYPLGARYWDSQETREINETTAELVGQEVGRRALADLGVMEPARQLAGDGALPGFNFRAYMRQTRQIAERLLALGEVDRAERFLASRRDELQRQGYAIRKLNQAYFAFYGSYTDSYAASPTNPTPDLVRQLRRQSSTVGEFLARIRTVTTLAELRQAVATAR
jgi:hypothetical protein